MPSFQDPMQKIDFDIYYIKSQSLSLSEKVAENHYICYWSENVSSLTDKLVLPNCKDAIQKGDFDIYDLKRQSLNSSEKVAVKYDICYWS